MTTDILSDFLYTDDTFENVNNEENTNLVTEKSYKLEDKIKLFFDGDNSILFRIKILENIYNENIQSCCECVNKISSMFMFSPTDINRQLLKNIVLSSNLNGNIKYDCCLSLYEENKVTSYECFNKLIEYIDEFPTPMKIDILKILMQTEEYYDSTISTLNKILTNPFLEIEYRYKLLVKLKEENIVTRYLYDSYLYFFNHKETYSRYKILSSSYILEFCENNEIRENVENVLISICTDTNMDYNIRADAADFLIRCGSDNSKTIGREMILLLGIENKKITTVYSDKQNVHDKDISESINKIIISISSKPMKLINGKYSSIDDIEGQIISILEKDESKINKVKSSLLRINIDTNTYYSLTLVSIFVKIWNIIENHRDSDQLKNRMIEELIDMADTCYSGHISRLINCLSGFEIDGDIFNINIGWEKQIYSNMYSKLINRIQKINDVEYNEKILEELSSNSEMIYKTNLNKFYRENINDIRCELYKEFVDEKYISHDEFEEHLRNCIIKFEC